MEIRALVLNFINSTDCTFNFEMLSIKDILFTVLLCRTPS